jgi:hypothetical protein
VEINTLISVYTIVKASLTKTLFLLKTEDFTKEIRILLCQYAVILDFVEKSIKLYGEYFIAGKEEQKKQVKKYIKYFMTMAAITEKELAIHNISFSVH